MTPEQEAKIDRLVAELRPLWLAFRSESRHRRHRTYEHRVWDAAIQAAGEMMRRWDDFDETRMAVLFRLLSTQLPFDDYLPRPLAERYRDAPGHGPFPRRAAPEAPAPAAIVIEDTFGGVAINAFASHLDAEDFAADKPDCSCRPVTRWAYHPASGRAGEAEVEATDDAS